MKHIYGDLLAEIERLRAALFFYADKATYETSSTGFAAQYDPNPEPITLDKGKRARMALYGKPE